MRRWRDVSAGRAAVLLPLGCVALAGCFVAGNSAIPLDRTEAFNARPLEVAKATSTATVYPHELSEVRLSAAATAPAPGGFMLRLGVFLPADSDFQRIYGSAHIAPALGYMLNIDEKRAVMFALDYFFTEGEPDIYGAVLRATSEFGMMDVQITGLYKPDPAQGLYVGGGIDLASFTESMTIVYTDFSTDSFSGSDTELGFHLIVGFERAMPTKRYSSAGLLLRLITVEGALGDVELGGLTLFGAVRF